MAPVAVTAAGVARQTIDDPRLVALLGRLSEFAPDLPPDPALVAAEREAEGNGGLAESVKSWIDPEPCTVDVEGLAAELEKWRTWQFQEQADLYEWIKPLDAIDAALAQIMREHPHLLLIGPSSRRVGASGPIQAESSADASSVPPSALRHLKVIIRFLCGLLRNATHKSVFNSVMELSDLLAAADDEVVALALEALANLSAPPQLHRQQAPETSPHSTALHNARPNRSGAGAEAPSASAGDGVHARLVSCARGWGSRGSGLELASCASADDSLEGRARLGRGRNVGGGAGAYDAAGGLSFEYFAEPQSASPLEGAGASERQPSLSAAPSSTGGGVPPTSRLVRVRVSPEEIMSSPPRVQPEKRRRTSTGGSDDHIGASDGLVASVPLDAEIEVRSTAELFFLALERAGGRGAVPPSRTFSLLTEVRLARSFHRRKDRISAVEFRLRALVAMLHAHPNQDVVGGYFAAQPELVTELCDLIRPTVSSAAVSSAVILRPTVDISSSEGSTLSAEVLGAARTVAKDGISAVADAPSSIPYSIRILAIEALTALVARRDPSGSNNAGCTVLKQATVLAELGVGKGQFLGLLPALIRYSLACLNSFLLMHGREGQILGASAKNSDDATKMDDDEALGLSLGLAFVDSTRAPPPSREEEEERALEFVDAVLTLTSAVVSVPSGTTALTECGLIPALVSTVALDSSHAALRQSDAVPSKKSSSFSSLRKVGDASRLESYSEVLLNFITAQAVQILESALVAHGNALSAFRDLGGVDLLVKRLSVEIEQIRREGGKLSNDMESGGETSDSPAVDDADVAMEDVGEAEKQKTDAHFSFSGKRPMWASRRVLLFSIVNCLTVVFHRQETVSGTGTDSTRASQSSGAAQLQRPELTDSLKDIMENVSSYGGVLAALAATLLSDVMNSDPQVVRYVHSSGLAESFLNMFHRKEDSSSGGNDVANNWLEPIMPASSELIMAVPNVLLALALTEDGANALKEANPFPSFLAIFCSSKYVMPTSRCLLDGIASIVGTGLDEIMRHVSSLRPLVISSVVRTLKRVLHIGKQSDEVDSSEMVIDHGRLTESIVDELAMNCLAQYASNIWQILGHILHTGDHVAPFVEAGGLDNVFELHPLLIPAGKRLLTQISCLSCPSVASMAHMNMSGTLTMAIKNMSSSYDCNKLLLKVMDCLECQLESLSVAQRDFRIAAKLSALESTNEDFASIDGLLEGIPSVPLHVVDAKDGHFMLSLSRYLKAVGTVEWLTSFLSSIIRSAIQRSHEMGADWGRSEREWKKEVSSDRFVALVDRLGALHRRSLLEICRVRTDGNYEEREANRLKPPGGGNVHHPAVYRLRIVCPDGAVVREGIELNSFASVGGLEMGEIVEAYDRCINSSGVMRYRTQRGWVSEQTRGHAREPIAEVLSVRGIASGPTPGAIVKRSIRHAAEGEESLPKRVECGMADLRSASASVLARLHNSQRMLFACLGRAVVLGVRSMPLRSLSFQHGAVGAYVGSVVGIVSKNLKANLSFVLTDSNVQAELDSGVAPKESLSSIFSRKATTLYLGSMLNLIHSCLYEEKRERHTFNTLLLLRLMRNDGFIEGLHPENADRKKEVSERHDTNDVHQRKVGLFGAVRFVLECALEDMERNASTVVSDSLCDVDSAKRVSRHISASLPPAVSLLRRLISRSLLSETQISSVLSKMKSKDLGSLLEMSAEKNNDDVMEDDEEKGRLIFHPVKFGRSVHCMVAALMSEIWNDKRLSKCPVNVLFPLMQLLGTVLGSLEVSAESSGDSSSAERPSTADSSGGSGNVTSDSGAQSELFRAMNAFLGGGAGRLRDAGESEGSVRPPPPSPFEPSEETISRLTEMGFSRDHALEALEVTESNRVEVAMEYCLSRPPPSPNTMERRRVEREERRRQREEAEQRREGSQRDSGGASPRNSAEGNSDSVPESADSDAARLPLPPEVEGESTLNPISTFPGTATVDDAVSMDRSGSNNESDTPSNGAKEEDMEVTEDGKEEKKNDCVGPGEDETVIRIKRYIQELKKSLIPVTFDLVEGSADIGENRGVALSGETAYGEPETLTVVACFFLLDGCERYPELRSSAVAEALERLKKGLVSVRGDKYCRVMDSHEAIFAAICHACVILLRALPRTRVLVLKEGLVGSLLGCVRNWCASRPKCEPSKTAELPKWLSPLLLLLDVMAQPTSVPLEVGSDESPGFEDDKGDTERKQSKEWLRVCGEHKKQGAHLSKAAFSIFSAVNSDDKHPRHSGRRKRTKEEAKTDSSSSSTGLPVAYPASLFTKIPTYQPLIPTESAEVCLSVCLQLLRACAKVKDHNGSDTANSDQSIDDSRGSVVHAALLLLTRLVRSHKMASLCLSLGGAELIISLPSGCRFLGNAGIVTVILRRLLEDELTLQTAMETEIRATVSKLHKKHSRGSASSDANPSITTRSFMQAITPLICRDPMVFIRAAATSVRLEVSTVDSSSGSNRQATRIVLLSSDDRARNTKILLDLYRKSGNKEQRYSVGQVVSSNAGVLTTPANEISQSTGKEQSYTTPSKRGRHVQRSKSADKMKASSSKSPHRSHFMRRSVSPKKSGRKEAQNTKKLIVLNGTPANHIISLLLGEMMKCVEKEKKIDTQSFPPASFLWLIDYIEILADLVLAVPACVAAIHRYRPGTKIPNALPGCPLPPSTAVSFFLHQLLPQPRVFLHKQQVEEDTAKSESKARTCAYMKVKISQTTARLLLALVARAGESRRRVIADLSFALSGAMPTGSVKGLDCGSSASSANHLSKGEDHEMWALQSWGELCIGIAAPRSTGISQDTNSSLSWEVVKLMLENAMAHALLSGIRRVKLHHPNAPSCAAALIRPLEVLTRGSVTDAVAELAEKAGEEGKATPGKSNPVASDGKKSARKSNSNSSLTRSVTIGPSQQSEAAFADDAMLEDGFDAETAERAARRSARQRDLDAEDYSMFEDAELEEVDDEEMDNESTSDDDENSEMPGDSIDGEESSEEDIDDDMSSDVDGDSMESSDDVSSESEADDDATEEQNEEVAESDSEQSEAQPDGAEDYHSTQSEDEDEDADADRMEGDDIDDVFDRDAREGEEVFFVGAREDDGDEDGDPDDEGDADEPWSFLGGNSGPVLSGRRGSGRHVGRAGGFMVEAAEAMIGNILREGGLQMEALAELEDTLGIRIVQRGGGPDQQSGNRHASSFVSRPSRVEGNDRVDDVALSIMDRGPIGSAPSVHQGHPPDSGYSSVGSHVGDSNAMEYLYGGPAVMSGSEYYVIGEPVPNADPFFFPVPPTVDVQMFPGGPAASMHARSQQNLHPLLCGIELPPFNALIPVRSRWLGIVSRGHRNGGSEWGNNAVVTSYMPGGQVLRISRGLSGSMLESSRTAGATSGSNAIVGWTDDGQPLDSTAGDFGVAFEQALSETIVQNFSRNGTETSAMSSPGGANEQDSAGSQDDQNANRGNTDQSGTSQNEEGRSVEQNDTLNESYAAGSGVLGTDVAETEGANVQQLRTASSADESAEGAAEANASEGEVVASSLASGLRLSPRSENSSSTDPMPTSPGANEENLSLPNGQSLQARSSPASTQNEEVNETCAAVDIGREAADVDVSSQDVQENQQVACAGDETGAGIRREGDPNMNGLVCPPGVDLEVFDSLPIEMQREVIAEHQATVGVAAQLDATSSLDPEALAALPEEMRREVIEQEQQERRLREETPADPSNAEDMDNASFVASLAPDLREEILLTADEAFLSSLPPDMQSEAQILRERAENSIRRRQEQAAAVAAAAAVPISGNGGSASASRSRGTSNVALGGGSNSGSTTGSSNRKRQRTGKMRVDCDRSNIIYSPSGLETHDFVTESSMKTLVKLMYLLSPVRPQKLLQKLVQNLCANTYMRKSFISTFVSLLNDDAKGALLGVKLVKKDHQSDDADFPPFCLIGTAPDISDVDNQGSNAGTFRRRLGGNTAASIAANLPASARGSLNDEFLPPVVAKRIIDTLLFLSKGSPRICLDMLALGTPFESDGIDSLRAVAPIEMLFDLIEKPLYSNSATNLEQLLTMLESGVSPLSFLPKDGEQGAEVSKREIDAAASAGKEYVEVPRVVVSPRRLQLFCSLLRLESCRDSSFIKVNTIARRLCRVESNRTCILRELALVAQGLGVDAIRDLRSLGIRLNDAVKLHREKMAAKAELIDAGIEQDGFLSAPNPGRTSIDQLSDMTPSSAVTLSTSSNEIKLLRVLQTLHVLCGELHDDNTKKLEGNHIFITQELVVLLKSIGLDSLWDQLASCLRMVSVLEGVSHMDEIEDKKDEEERENEADQDEEDQSPGGGKKLQNSVAGLLTRFLPTIEAFFVVNASSIEDKSPKEGNEESSTLDGKNDDHQSASASAAEARAIVSDDKSEPDKDEGIKMLVGGKRLVEFVGTNKVLLNALLRSNPALLEKSLRAMVQVPRCRPFLDFDVKRHWFKAHVRRLRQHAGRRYGSLRLHIRRKHVFEDAFHQLQLRNAEEMRGRLHITFRNEEGVDAGGLSREFFAILAKEMFNPNYALFTSTEDGCTFQPNPNSSINPDHLRYFRFVGRIVGKAVLDGFLLDAHFTRSLYKHMLGVKPTHHDMEAIDPDYYRNLVTILEHDLDDLGLELTFSIDEHIFGRSQSVNLIEGGNKIKVTESNKAKYVSLVCQHRMTTAIKSQLKAFLDGFHELVKPDLISIFTAKELELLISGMPDIDIHDLKKNTDYNGYRPTDKEIGWFWNVMFSLSRSEKAAFLQFVTGSSKVPLNGFSELQGMRGIQKFSIHRAGGSSGALMSAHTCFNSLDLPIYKSEEETREKLLYAISEGAGAFMFA